MKKILKLTFVLFIVCAIVAGVLGVINEITYETIKEQNRIKTERAYKAVLDSEGYTPVEFSEDAFPTVDVVNECADGKGYVVVMTFSGAQGKMTMAVGVDSEDKCTGISVIKHSETSGLGAVAASTAEAGVKWRAQFVGEDESIALMKSGGNIDAISGATITSKSVTNAVATAIAAVKALH